MGQTNALKQQQQQIECQSKDKLTAQRVTEYLLRKQTQCVLFYTITVILRKKSTAVLILLTLLRVI